jgi:type I restriction enzyme M protein
MQNLPSISETVRGLRDRAGLTQEGLARELGVSFATVNRWENGKITPDRVALVDLRIFAERYGSDTAELLPALDAAITDAAESPRRRGRKRGVKNPTLPAPSREGGVDVKAMEAMLWKAACSIRGEKDAPKFKDYLLPLLFLKRLSDVFEDEFTLLVEEYDGDQAAAREVLDAVGSEVVRFQLPEFATWAVISGRKPYDWAEAKKPKTLGEHITLALRALAKQNDELRGVVDIVDFNETRNGEREVSDAALRRIIELFSEPRYRLGLKEAEPDFLGRAYEYLLRKFAEGQGQSAGEFFTPTEVGWLIAHLVEPKEGESVYDFACGSAGLLIKCELLLDQRMKAAGKIVERPLQMHGQELTGASFAIARMNMVIHDMAGQIVRGDTIANPKFLMEKGQLRQFDIVVANPMWNQKTFEMKQYENDPYERFTAGYPPESSADWAWLQHAVASMNAHGRAAIVVDTGAMSRGSGNQGDSREKFIRQHFVESDLVEGVVLLPDNLFYNTPAAGVIVVLNREKRRDRRRRIILIDASRLFTKGRPKNFLDGSTIDAIATAFADAKTRPGLASVVSVDDVAANDFNLIPSLYVSPPAAAARRDVATIIADLDKAVTVEQGAEALLRDRLRSFGYRV